MDRRHNVGPKGRAAFWDYDTEYWNVPLMRNDKIVERPADQTTITRRYAEEAVRFIAESAQSPFFLYIAHNMPHVPLFTSQEFRHRSLRGRYGDVIEEIDWSVGQVLDALREHQLQRETLVVFTSDNGPWLVFDEQGGSAGLLREGKGCTFEGGMREPTVFWWPGVVSPGVIMEQGSTLDLLPTFASLAGVQLPEDLILDGYDLTGTLLEKKRSPRNEMYYYRGQELYAVRKGAFKAHFITKPAYGGGDRVVHDPPLLYQLNSDPSERYNIAGENPEMVEQLEKMAEAFRQSFEPPPSQLEIPLK
jgi:arylsulfatase A-like enzyme